MGVLIFVLSLQGILIFLMGLSPKVLIKAFLFQVIIKHEMGIIFSHFELNDKFFKHLWNKMEDFLLRVRKVELRDNNNQLKNYGQILI